jgi:hypothetical protein
MNLDVQVYKLSLISMNQSVILADPGVMLAVGFGVDIKACLRHR